jgi:triacylglycerol lipase
MPRETTWSDLLHPEEATVYFDRNPLPAFDPAATGYRRENAYWLAELSRLVYRDFKKQPSDEILSNVGLTLVKTFNDDRTDTQGFLVRSSSPAFAALVFRGTQQKVKDFLLDAALVLKPAQKTGSNGVHTGFHDGLESVWTDVSAALDTLPADCPVFYTGHSLGAALATLAATRRSLRAAYVFGCPRVGNAGFVAGFANLPIYRVVDGSDVVTMVPPEDFDYRHGGELESIGTKMAEFSFDSPAALLKLLVAAFLDLLRHPPQFLADHAPINYVERV